MFKIAVCDDDENMLNRLMRRVRAYCKRHNIKAAIADFCESGRVVELIEGDKLFDVYLLDIKMPEYSGLEIARRLKGQSFLPYVIFVTEYDKYAVEACRLNAFWYICKSELDQQLELMLDELFASLNKRVDDEVYIINNKRKYVRIYYKDIIYIRKNQKNIEFILVGGKRVQERITLKEAYRRMKGKMLLLDRSLMSNPIHIQKIEHNEIIMDEGHVITVNESHISEVKKALKEYWKKASNQWEGESGEEGENDPEESPLF